jgi:hypothetical protein
MTLVEDLLEQVLQLFAVSVAEGNWDRAERCVLLADALSQYRERI